jgi:hypothetical protein
MNVRGLTYLKLVAILEQDDFDVLCLQETWMAEPADPPIVFWRTAPFSTKFLFYLPLSLVLNFIRGCLINLIF